MTPPVSALSDHLVAKWTSPQGARLMAAGAKIVDGLLELGPLTHERAGRMLGWPPQEVLPRFEAMDFRLETDPDGNIIGAGVSLNEARPHSMELRGRTVYGWCAMDTLMFPLALDEAVSHITSRCAATGEPVRATVTPSGVRDVHPATAAVTLAPATGADIREVFCNRVNFYADEALANQVTGRDSDLAVCSTAEAWAVGRRLADLF
ncbi:MULTISPECIES: organomercurial lyase [Streptomyces]|uniref:Alkylmercury (Organomercurial) lyase MerB n=1 Tax=Streptomyces lasiicapitis TaxID=1923961 RepID=A0ABQ2LTP5_9ACTN|nr:MULTISPECIES: organomercurial lyase [Streptomyces]QIB44614.1 alkylmercury lyase [Streptomyces aureoverticillatus]GGO42956.1 alkylmercury (organomercurial) lyase MerB [Streptomyces lasiicapitis]